MAQFSFFWHKPIHYYYSQIGQGPHLGYLSYPFRPRNLLNQPQTRMNPTNWQLAIQLATQQAPTQHHFTECLGRHRRVRILISFARLRLHRFPER